jgi:hypothetical protein
MEMAVSRGADLGAVLPRVSSDDYLRVRHWDAFICAILQRGQPQEVALSLMKRFKWAESTQFFRLILSKDLPLLIPNTVQKQRNAVLALL